MPEMPIQAKLTTTAGKKVAPLTLLVKYQTPIYKAGKEVTQFTFRADQQRTFFKCESGFLALIKTLYVERTKYSVAEYAFYDNRPEAPPYPQNIIVHKMGDVIIHDNSSDYPPQVSALLLKYKMI